MELLHNFFHNERTNPGNSLMQILRSGYLRHSTDSKQYGMLSEEEGGSDYVFLGVNISRRPYAALHLDWRLLTENSFDFHLGWGGPIYNPYDAIEYTDSKGAFTDNSFATFAKLVDTRKSLYNNPPPMFSGKKMTESQIYDVVDLYRKQNDIYPDTHPIMLTEITVSRKISLRKYLSAIHDDMFSVPELIEIIEMYPNIRIFAARRDIPSLQKKIPAAHFVPRVRKHNIDGPDVVYPQ